MIHDGVLMKALKYFQINDSEDDVYLCERMRTVSLRIVENLILKNVHSGDTIALVLKNHDLDSPILIACCFLGVTMCVLPHNLNVGKTCFLTHFKITYER